MGLNIGQCGIVQRHKDGSATLLRPGRNGGPGTEIAISTELADEYRLATGDVVAGKTEALGLDHDTNGPDIGAMEEEGWDSQFDEPTARRSPSRFNVTSSLRFPTVRMTEISQINGLEGEEISERPYARTQRSRSERTSPDRLMTLAIGSTDSTGRMLDLAAPLGAGVFGIIHGAHGTGLTTTLQAVLGGLLANAPVATVPLILLLRPRSEEATEWRKRFPQADIVVGSSEFSEGTPQQTVRICDLMLEAAQRQTESGKDVVVLVDSLTALWGALLEAEEADAQQEADSSRSRQRVREWVQKAGCFHGEAPLGGGLGGSLTIIGTVWNQGTDAEAEEDRELHPNLRLMEHILPEAGWLVALSENLMRQRLYPAIDITRCRSQHEEKLLPAEYAETLFKTRGSLPRRDPLAVYERVMDALHASSDLPSLLAALGPPQG